MFCFLSRCTLKYFLEAVSNMAGELVWYAYGGSATVWRRLKKLGRMLARRGKVEGVMDLRLREGGKQHFLNGTCI